MNMIKMLSLSLILSSFCYADTYRDRFGRYDGSVKVYSGRQLYYDKYGRYQGYIYKGQIRDRFGRSLGYGQYYRPKSFR